MHKNVNLTACTARSCSHTFNLWSDSVPSSYNSVSVAAVNVVGVGAVRTCTTQTISKLVSIYIKMCDSPLLKLNLISKSVLITLLHLSGM